MHNTGLIHPEETQGDKVLYLLETEIFNMYFNRKF